MEKAHIVMLPVSGQGHINPMLQLAKHLHSKGLYITFINTESSKQSMLSSQGPDALQGLERFRFETIPDGLLSSSSRSQERVARWCMSTHDNCVAPFRELLVRLNETSGVPRITCIVYNWLMSFALDVANELSIPALVFSTMSACGFMADLHLDELIGRGYTPLKDESYLINGYLDTTIDWIPGMKDMRLRDLPSFIRTVDAEDFFLNYCKAVAEKSLKAQGLILNTFDLLETDVLNAFRAIFANVYAIGPLPALLRHIAESPITSLRLSPWKEDDGCMQWLNQQRKGSVIYVSFGSIATVCHEQITEFAWGLANSNHPFLWVIRPDLVSGSNHVILPEGFIQRTNERWCYLASWCKQDEVLSHASVGGFLTHCGWNSTLESICGGVPMICWPGFADQCVNTRYVCKEWGIGVEIDEGVTRDRVTAAVKELMEGEKGGEMRRAVLKWKKSAKLATMQAGSSYEEVERFAEDLNAMRMGSSRV